MSKIKIRNNGFERGNTDFWESYSDAVISAYDTDQKWGVYSGKAVYNSNAIDGLLTADYIDVVEGEILKIGGYIRPNATRYGGIRVIQYDGDYSLIGVNNLTWCELAAAWNYETGLLHVPYDVEYLRLGYVNGGLSAGKSLLVDSVSATKIDERYIQPLALEIRPLSAFNTSFTTSGSPIDLKGCRELFVSMDYNYVSGNANSIVVSINEADMVITGVYQVGTHTITAVNTSEDKRIALTRAAGNQVYVTCTVDTPASLVAYMGLSLIGCRK